MRIVDHACAAWNILRDTYLRSSPMHIILLVSQEFKATTRFFSSPSCNSGMIPVPGLGSRTHPNLPAPPAEKFSRHKGLSGFNNNFFFHSLGTNAFNSWRRLIIVWNQRWNCDFMRGPFHSGDFSGFAIPLEKFCKTSQFIDLTQNPPGG